MANLDEQQIRNNIFRLVLHSGISEINLSLILDISDRQLKRIKESKGNFNIASINKACEFFNCEVEHLNSEELNIVPDFRDRLKKVHKGNIEYEKILDDRPSLTFVIKFVLIQNKAFLTKGISVKNIREYLSPMGYDYSSSHISLGMARLEKIVKRFPDPENPRTFLYLRK